MGNAGDAIVRHRAAKLFFRYILVRHRLDNIGTGDEHVRRVLHHDVKVGDCRTVNRTAGAWSKDATDLRHHATGQRVAQKNIRVTAETDDAFLNARAAGIIQSDDRRADFHRQVHYFANLFGVSFRKRTAKDREVLRENENLATIDQTVTGNYAVAGIELFLHAKISRAMDHQLIEFFKRSFIQQELDALARGQLVCGVLLLNARGTAAGFSLKRALF